MTEKQFQNNITQLAKQLGWLVYHTYDSRRSEPGFPDLVLVRERTLLRELKTDTGRLTKTQKYWIEKLQTSGQDCDVWRPKDTQMIANTLMKKEKM